MRGNDIVIVIWIAWLVLGLFITPIVYRRRGLNPWVGAIVGALVGVLTGIIGLLPLWIFAGRRRERLSPAERALVEEYRRTQGK